MYYIDNQSFEKSLYFHKDFSCFTSTSITDLINSSGCKLQYNINTIYNFLLLRIDNEHLTYYKNIFRVPPRHKAIVSQNEIILKRYDKEIEPIIFKNDEEYVQAFYEKYKCAVKKALGNDSIPAICLSSGLDSTSVAYLASKRCREIHSFTSIPAYLHKKYQNKRNYGDEQPLIEKLSKNIPNLKTNFLDSKQTSPIEGIITFLNIFRQPVIGTVNLYWILDIYKTARECGFKTLLNGQKGNFFVSYAGIKRNRNIIDYLNYFFVNGLKFGFKEKLLRPCEKITASIFLKNKYQFDQGLCSTYSPMNSEILKNAGLYNLSLEEVRAKFRNEEEKFGFRFLFDRSLDIYQHLDTHFDIQTKDPTDDAELKDFILHVPENQFNRYGFSKYLFKRAFYGRLPNAILFNTKKGRQAQDICQRLLHEWDRVKTILCRFDKSDTIKELLDMPKLHNILEDIKIRQDNNIFFLTTSNLMRGIMVGLFLLQFEGDDWNKY